jgi:hypothetical protein
MSLLQVRFRAISPRLNHLFFYGRNLPGHLSRAYPMGLPDISPLAE